jgi:hypothetical protein
MSNKELVETAKQVIDDLGGLHGTKTACDCLRLFCERIEQTKEIAATVNSIKVQANENIEAGEAELFTDWYKLVGVLITNRQALDIAKYTPLYHE